MHGPSRPSVSSSPLRLASVGELRTLQWRHVVEEPRPHLVLEGTKSGKVRRVPLSAGAVEAIEGLRKITESVFVSPYRAVNPCCIAYPIRDRMPKDIRFHWHWHQLRHTFASRYLEHGGSLAALQRMLGHSTSRMTERYASISDESLFADLERTEAKRAASHPQPVVAQAIPGRKHRQRPSQGRSQLQFRRRKSFPFR